MRTNLKTKKSEEEEEEKKEEHFNRASKKENLKAFKISKNKKIQKFFSSKIRFASFIRHI